MEKFNLKVVLPSGEVTVPVDAISTPGHLKENLKYSIRLPPKFIKLTVDGKELDDLKPMNGEPNNLVDGSIVIAQAKEGHEVEAAEAAAAAEAAERAKQASSQPTMIKKEEPPKPKKVKKDAVRPTLGESDVVKKETLSPGYKTWQAETAYLEGKSAKRHMAFLKVEAVDEKKIYPEQENDSMVIALGDPHTSPVWTAAVTQLDIGEKATFAMPRKLVDFDPEGLNPTDSTATWTIELCRIAEVQDVNQDFAALLFIEKEGSKDRAQDLDRVAVHWRIRRWMAEGTFCIGSSRERIAIMPGYGLVPIEDVNAPAVMISVGEGQQEAVELIAMSVGKGGSGHMYVKSESMKGNRPQGCVIFDVELVDIELIKGPGSPGWNGWKMIINERETGDHWLEEADARRKQLETFETMRKSTTDSKDAEHHVAEQVHKHANNAARRYRRALSWAQAEDGEDKKIKKESCVLGMRLAKAQTMAYARFGEEKGEASEAEKKACTEARELLATVLKTAEELKNEELTYECLRLNLQVCIQSEDEAEAAKLVEQIEKLRPGDEELKSDKARLYRMQKAIEIKKGTGTIEGLQTQLREANEAVKDGDAEKKPQIVEALAAILELMKNKQVKYADVTKMKIGKDVGMSMKLGDPELSKAASTVVQQIQKMAQDAALGL